MSDSLTNFDSKELLSLLFTKQAKILGYDTTLELNNESNLIYQGSSTETEKKLVLLKVKELLSLTSSLVTSEINQQTSAEESAKLDSALQSNKNLLLKLNDVQGLEPRGRFNLSLTSSTSSSSSSTSSLILEGKTFSAVINIENISCLIVVPNHSSAKKDGEKCVLIVLKEPTLFSGKPVKNFLLNLLCERSKQQISIGYEKSEVDLFLDQIKENFSNLKIFTTDPLIFTSSLQNKSFIRCYKGTQEGALYPLSCGILFLKPVLFIPIEEISSLNAGRGSGSTRFVDLYVRYYILIIFLNTF